VLILLTGGSGSFGEAFLARHHENHTIRVLSRGEHAQARLAETYPDVKFFIGDIRDRDRVARAVKGVDLVVHAAALKGVGACEYNPSEAVATNVTGAQNVVDVAGCRIIAISTDKAVYPVNTYGMTKALAEKIFRLGGATICRYGNVLDSQGSVTHAFRHQFQRWGELHITDRRMTRFFLTQTKAQELVEEAMTGAEGLLVPRVPSARIVDLAEAMYPGFGAQVVGIRPGEKLHETLLTPEEAEDGIEFRSDTNPGGTGPAR
jgi:UDP-N-acetylglucosamine 4,6-dehydratase/5-epimerase